MKGTSTQGMSWCLHCDGPCVPWSMVSYIHTRLRDGSGLCPQVIQSADTDLCTSRTDQKNTALQLLFAEPGILYEVDTPRSHRWRDSFSARSFCSGLAVHRNTYFLATAALFPRKIKHLSLSHTQKVPPKSTASTM